MGTHASKLDVTGTYTDVNIETIDVIPSHDAARATEGGLTLGQELLALP